MRLTDLLIKQIQFPETGQKTYFDDALPGFGVRVSQGGAKSFVVMSGRARKLKTLGRYPDLTLSDARKKAKLVQAVEEPQSPGLPSVTFSNARDRFIEDTKARTKTRTVDEYERLLKRHFPFENELTAVSRKDIVEHITKLRNVPSIEQHAFVAIRTMMNWCVRHGLLDVSPVPKLRFSTHSRTRVLTDDELKSVWNRAQAVGYPYGAIVQLLILTGQRRGEIAGLRRSWIEDDAITFPAGFTKNKREHRIPIGPLTKEIIAAIPGTTDLLFPAKGKGKEELPFNGWSKCKSEFDKPLSLVPYTLHDFRRTYSSNLAKLDVPIHVTEKLLNHVSGTISGVAAVYNRHSYWEEMISAIAVHEANLPC